MVSLNELNRTLYELYICILNNISNNNTWKLS